MTESEGLIQEIELTQSAIEHVELIKKLLKRNSYLFYEGKETEIADDVFDKYEKEVQLYEPTFRHRDLIEVNDFHGDKLPHTVTYRDFSKVNDLTEMTDDWFNNIQSKYITCAKWDGSSVAIYLKNGAITRILSRHDDIVGVDQTTKLMSKAKEAISKRFKTTSNRPLTDIKCILAECVAVLEDGKSDRARSNGLVNSKYIQDDVDKYANLMIFDVIYNDNTYEPNIYYQLTLDQFKSIRDTGKFMTDVGDIICDGIVNYSRDFNDTKLDIHKIYYNDAEETDIAEISWEVSWTSAVYHPVANFYPIVQLEGTNVGRAGLYNYKYMVDAGCGIGARVKVIKANSTIPKIDKVIKPVFIEDPDHYYDDETVLTKVQCPFCGSPLMKFGNTDLVCSNKSCNQITQMLADRILEQSGVKPEVRDEMWALELTKLSNLIDFIKSQKLDTSWMYFENPNFNPVKFMNLLYIPRLSGSKIELINKDWHEHKEITRDKLGFESILNNYFSGLNWSYYTFIMNSIEMIKDLLK
jgi:hypothetical protein